MIEILIEQLNLLFARYVEQLDNTVAAIEMQLKKEERSPREVSRLEEALWQLRVQRLKMQELLESVNSIFLPPEVRYPPGRAVYMIVDDHYFQADKLSSAANSLRVQTDEMLVITKGIEEQDATDEKSTMGECLRRYESVAREMAQLCHETAVILQDAGDAAWVVDAQVMAQFKDSSEPVVPQRECCRTASKQMPKDEMERLRRLEIENRAKNECKRAEKIITASPPNQSQLPHQPVYSAPTAPPPFPATASCSQTVTDYMEKRKTAGPVKEKRGFLGLFRRKSKSTGGAETVTPPPKIDSVRFSAVAGARVAPGKYLPINLMMYEDEYRKAVDELLRSHGDGAKEARSGYHEVQRNAVVKVSLSSPDMSVEDIQEQVWNGKYLNFEFAVKIPKDYGEDEILFVASVYVNGIIATKLKLILDCRKRQKYNLNMERADVNSAFVSYASQDRSRVATIIQGMKKARPDLDIFFDIESLRSGQKWEEVLKIEIENRDVLFLCWSRFAKDSSWVDMEWRYALEKKGEQSIEPIPIDSPDVCPPPAELNKKHFHDKMLYFIKDPV